MEITGYYTHVLSFSADMVYNRAVSFYSRKSNMPTNNRNANAETVAVACIAPDC